MKQIALLLLVFGFGCMVGGDELPAGIDDPGTDQGTGDLDTVESAHALPGCTSVTTVILYSEDTYDLRLPQGFAAAQNNCTRYYVNLPALSSDKTMPRPEAASVHALGPHFYALAEFSWSAWKQWIDASPGTRDWETAGKLFRQRMIDAGYDVGHGDTWAINEFPLATHSGDNDVWTHEQSAVKALYEGDGSASSQGVVYVAGIGQSLANLGVYKSNVKGWLQQDAFWNAMQSYVRWFGIEVYADPHLDCGSNVPTDSAYLDAYLEHIPRLADAGGSASGVAAAYLRRSYFPLVSAAWGSDGGFGNNLIPLSAFEQYSRLQVYATHLWAAGHGYPGRRLGFAFAPQNATVDQQTELAGVIANSVARAYPDNKFYNLGKLACSTAGSLDGCGCQVSGAYNASWGTFATW